MHSYHFAKSFIERGKRRFCSGTACCCFVACVAASRASFATVISTRFWQWSSVRCGCLGWNTKCCKLRLRPSNSTSTPRRHDGFFSFVQFLRYLWNHLFSVWEGYSLPITGWVIYLSVSRPCLLALRGMYYRLCAVVCFIIFLLSPYFLLALPLCSRIV